MGRRIFELIRRLRIVGSRAGDANSDGALLERYVASADGEAFGALVARHGPMLLAVCRRVLGNPHAAEDAFQATFLALARHAKVVRRRSRRGCTASRVARRCNFAARRSGARLTP